MIKLVSNHARQSVQFPLGVPMLRNVVCIRIHKALGALHHVQRLLHVARLETTSSHNTIRIHHLSIRAELHPLDTTRIVHKLDRFPVAPIALQCPNASRTQCTTRPCFCSVATCSPPGM
jgi:hypothetical protein